jgi:hypothetical protein
VRTPRIEKLNASLLAALSASPPGERLAFLEQVAAWARSHRDACRTETLEQLGLDRLLELDLARYPTGSSALDPADELASLRRAPAPSRDALAMRLRDILWQGVTVESAATCPVVPSAFGLRVLVSSAGDQIVYGAVRTLASDRTVSENGASVSYGQPTHWRVLNFPPVGGRSTRPTTRPGGSRR